MDRAKILESLISDTSSVVDTVLDTIDLITGEARDLLIITLLYHNTDIEIDDQYCSNEFIDTVATRIFQEVVAHYDSGHDFENEMLHNKLANKILYNILITGHRKAELIINEIKSSLP